MTKPVLIRALDHAKGRKAEAVDLLTEFLRIPSVSADPAHKLDVRRAAKWLAAQMRDSGLENVRLVDTNGHPLVLADWLHAGDDAPTVLVYGHGDVQPPDPLDEWESGPFSPTIDGQYIVARGASDDKGQLYMYLEAVRAYLETSGALPVNLRFIVEHEEESGGSGLADYLRNPANREHADLIVLSDTAMRAPGEPAICSGLRGIIYLELRVKGPTHDLHSGGFGGGIQNPLNVLCQVIAGCQALDGKILIPGFCDGVRSLSQREAAILNQTPVEVDELLQLSGAPNVWERDDCTLAEALGVMPTFEVHGIVGGYTAPGAKTIIPAEATAKISMRLAAGQDPAAVAAAFERHVLNIAPDTVTVEVDFFDRVPAVFFSPDSPELKVAAKVLEDTFGTPPSFIFEGGSIPVMAVFEETLGLPAVLMGFGLPDDRIHSPNERFLLANFHSGIEAIIRFFDAVRNDLAD